MNNPTQTAGKPKPLEVWNANVHFEDMSGAKNRPVVVLEKKGDDFAVFMITSHSHYPETDVKLFDPYEVMLDKTSTVRTDRVFLIPSAKFNTRLGTLCGDDAEMMPVLYERVKRRRLHSEYVAIKRKA